MAAISAAKTVWQRMANRCFVLEDAKRAPKVACCSSSSPALRQSTGESFNVPRHPIPASCPNLPRISKWWLQRNALKHGPEGLLLEEPLCSTSCTMSCWSISGKDESIRGGFRNNSMIRQRIKNKSDMGMVIPWLDGDRDKLDFVTARKSLDHHHNNELAALPDTKTKSSWCRFNVLENFGQEGSSLDDAVHFPQGGVYGKDQLIHGMEKMKSDSSQSGGCTDSLQSSGCNYYEIATSKDQSNRLNSAHELTKAQLLKALLHSQTRARKAEKAALQACHEKDQILKLFFNQASQLVVYEQLLQFLQLEALHIQLKSKDSGLYFLFSLNMDASEDNISNVGRRIQREGCWHNDDRSAYAIAIAVGLSLAGAGLLFGWTIEFWLSAY